MAVPFGKYELLKKIGVGGMGQVFLARAQGAQGFEKLLVIKRLLPHLTQNEEFVSMFFDEARLAARLNHPNLIQIFDLGEVDGAPYLAMEYVQGEDLRRMERFARSSQKPIPLPLVLRIVADVAAGLDYAHKAMDAQGVPLSLVHRDVSPQNVLVGVDGAVKLIDFGVAKAIGRAHETTSGVLKGKYAYMSPEQATGLPLDARSDQFALGVILWELLTGKRLFKAESELITIRLVSDCLVPAPSKVAPGLDPTLDALVLRALAKLPSERFADCAAFRLALEDFLIERRLAASAAHLQAFLRELYAERIAKDAKPESLDELTSLPAPETPSGSASSPRRGVFDKVTPMPGSTQRISQSVRGRSWAKWTGVLASFVAAAAIGAGIGLAHREPDPPPVEIPQRLSVEPDLPRRDTVVRLELRSAPAGAAVKVDGQAVGVTPFLYSFPLSRSPVVAEFSLAGFEPFVTTFSSKDVPALEVQLKKKSKPKRNGATLDLDIKTGR